MGREPPSGPLTRHEHPSLMIYEPMHTAIAAALACAVARWGRAIETPRAAAGAKAPLVTSPTTRCV
eukprot:1672-Eustigmatos_ZCMA.PRE.1